MKPIFAGLVLALSLAGSGLARAATDDFAAACLARGKTSPQNCDCQARLAKASFSADERRIAIVAMRGGGDAFRASMAKMTPARRQTFVAKMQTLSQRTQAECR